MAKADSLLRPAIGRLERQQPPVARQLLAARLALGRLRVAQGRPAEALALLRPVVRESEEQYSATDRRTAEAQLALGMALRGLRRFEETEPLLLRGHATLQAARVAQPWREAQARAAVEGRYVAWGKPERARSFASTVGASP